MKSKKLAILFVALGLAVPSLAGCSVLSFGNVTSNDASENSVSENGQNSQPGEDNSQNQPGSEVEPTSQPGSQSNPTSQPGGVSSQPGQPSNPTSQPSGGSSQPGQPSTPISQPGNSSQPSGQSQPGSASTPAPSSQPGSSSQSGGSSSQSGGQDQPGQGVETYQGDTTKTVGKINNTPVTEYSQDAKDAIMLFAKTISDYSYQSIYDGFTAYMLKMKVGNELAIEFCNTFIDFYGLAMQSFPAYNPEPLGQNAEKMNALCYKFLTILNSIDVSTVASVLEEVNKEYKASRQEEYDNRQTLQEYYSVNVGNTSYSEYSLIKRVKEATNLNNSDINKYLAAYETAMNNFAYPEYALTDYQNYVDRLQKAIDEPVIPTMVIDFIRKHASEAQALLVKDLKLIVDAYCSMIPELLDAIKESNRGPELYYSYNYQYFYPKAEQSSSNVARASYETLLNNKDLYLGLLKAIVADPALGDLLLDAMIEIMLPAYRQYANPEEADLTKVSQLETRLKALSGQQVSSLVNFLIKVLALIEDEDIAFVVDLLEAMTYTGDSGNDFSAQLFALGDKYSAKLSELIAGLTANEKNDILSVGQIFKIDLLKEIQDFLTIYNTRDLTTEEGAQAFMQAVQEWAMKIYNTLEENFLFMFHGGKSAETKPMPDDEQNNEESPLYFDFNHYPVLNEQFDAEEDIIINGKEEFSGYVSWNNLKYWNQAVEEAKTQLAYYLSMPDEERQYYEYDIEMYTAISQMEITNFSLTVDTSKCGYMPYVIAYTYKGQDYTYKGTISVTVPGLDSISSKYMYFNDSDAIVSYSYRGGYDVPIVLKGGVLKYTKYVQIENSDGYYVWEEREFTIDTSKLGWNVIIEADEYNEGHSSVFIYYVIDPTQMSEHMTDENYQLGYVMKGQQQFANSAYSYVRYSYEDGYLTFSNSDSLTVLPETELSNKPVNKELSYVDPETGMTYRYFIADTNKKISSTLEFSLYGYYHSYSGDEDPNNIFAHDWSAEEIAKYNGTSEPIHFRISERVSYYVEVEGCPKLIYVYETPTDKASNFNYQNGVFSFTYQNVVYSYVIKGASAD